MTSLVEGADRVECAAQLVRRQEGAGRRDRAGRGRHVDAARDAAGPAIAVAAGAGVLRRQQRVDRADAPSPIAASTASLPTISGRSSRTMKCAGGRGLRRAGLDRAAFAAHFCKPPSSTAASSKPKIAQHPPHPRRPLRAVGAVEDDPGPVADAEAAHRRGERLGRGQHEAQAPAAGPTDRPADRRIARRGCAPSRNPHGRGSTW